MRRLLLAALLAPVLLLLAAAGASASVIGDAAAALQTDPVYVAPGAQEHLSPAGADAVRRRIERGDAGPVYVAVLPASAADEAGGSADEVTRALAEQVGRRATYATIVGKHFSAGSYVVHGVPGDARAALAAHGSEGAAATLEDFVGRVAQSRAGRGGGRSGSGGAGGGGLVALLVLLGGGALLATSLSRRRRRREERAQLEELRTAARDDLVALGDDVRGVDLDVEMPNANPRARDELARGLEAYDRAERLLDHAQRPEDIAEVTRTVGDGRQAMAACRALLDGREPPPHRPPCFFDPRHGPSVEDLPWAPHGGQERDVPVCAACATRLRHGEEPDPREVLVGGRAMPYFMAPSYFSPWAGGFFGGFGGGSMFLPGLFGGMMLGEMLDGPGVAWGGGWDGGGWDGGGDPGGGGGFDVGGGDFGGGDFGGGDF